MKPTTAENSARSRWLFSIDLFSSAWARAYAALTVLLCFRARSEALFLRHVRSCFSSTARAVQLMFFFSFFLSDVTESRPWTASCIDTWHRRRRTRLRAVQRFVKHAVHTANKGNFFLSLNVKFAGRKKNNWGFSDTCPWKNKVGTCFLLQWNPSTTYLYITFSLVITLNACGLSP